MWRSENQRLTRQVDQKRPLPPIRHREQIVELVDAPRACTLDAHAGGDFHEVEIGIAEIEHIERGAAGIGADSGIFAEQDRIFAVGKNQSELSKFSGWEGSKAI